MEFLNLILGEVASYVATIFIVILIAVITYSINRVWKWIKPVLKLLGIELVEVEVYHVAKRVRKYKQGYYDVYSEVLDIVSNRLEEVGIKVSSDELSDIIKNTLDDLVEEEGENKK